MLLRGIAGELPDSSHIGNCDDNDSDSYDTGTFDAEKDTDGKEWELKVILR